MLTNPQLVIQTAVVIMMVFVALKIPAAPKGLTMTVLNSIKAAIIHQLARNMGDA